jgi:hypothetical protein
METKFLFIVGMPRSGTKLIRDLLNQHPSISIPEVETHFLPEFIRKYGINFPLNNHKKKEMLNDFLDTTFYWHYINQGHFINDDFRLQFEQLSSWDEFSALIFAYFSATSKVSTPIRGDKTPGYLKHITLLRKAHSNSKFIHIIRDPRDYCLSVANIWNKNIYRACDSWTKNLANSNKHENEPEDDYLVVKYEDLIQSVKITQQRISSFLGIPYVEKMTTLRKPAENYGEAKGRSEIVKNNSGKYINRLSNIEIKKIEELCFDQMLEHNYKIRFGTAQRKLPLLEISYYQIIDLYNSLKFHIKEKGVITGARYFLKLHFQSSWR